MKEALRVLRGFSNYIPEEGFKMDRGILPLVKEKVGDASRYRTAARTIAENLYRQGALGGAFLLHDGEGQYRLGYVEFLYRGRRKPLPRVGSVLYRPDHPNKTFRQRLALLEKRAQRGEPLTLEALREALSVDAVTEEFYREFARLFNGLLDEVQGVPKKRRQEFLLALVARVLFLAFVAKRGWLGGREDFLPWLLERYRAEGLWGKGRFYSEWLFPLFFAALKGPPGRKGTGFDHLPQEVREAYLEAPYLNGELFRPKPGIDEPGAFLSDEGVERLFGFLFAYNFTVEENTAYETDLELNPEFLGLILERLVNTLGVEGKTDELGAHYTPRVEVDLMVRLGLAELLGRKGLPLEKAYALMGGEAEALEEGEKALAREVLLKAKVLDPAVGSGAFLVGTLQVLEETLDLLGSPRTLDRKKRLLQNLHGVDALSWAVWMAELRLWLAYFLELPDGARASEEPLLPSLGLKVVQGDSVVQRVGQQPIPTRFDVEPNLLKDGAVREALSRLVDAKEGYFHNRGVLPEEVQRLEGEFLLALLEAKAKRGLEQGLLVEGKSEQHQREVEVLREALDAGDRPFLYLVDFAEVMAGEGGFDLVIGNPPYVRQEEIKDPLGRYDPKDYKAYLQEEAKGDFRYFHGLGNAISISGRSDLYTYFYLRTLALLKPTGVHVFIASNSWLDVQYGAWLQEVFLRAVPLRFAIENRVRRSFRADVNVAITVAWAPRKVEPGWRVRFLAVEAPFEEVDLLNGLRGLQGEERSRVGLPGMRMVQKEAGALLKEAEGKEGRYEGGKWGGLYLRAPEIYYRILEQFGDRLVRLGDVAEVKRGLTTGANDFFYLRPLPYHPVCPLCGSVHEDALTREAEEAYWRRGEKPPEGVLVAVGNGLGWKGYLEAEALVPIYKEASELLDIPQLRLFAPRALQGRSHAQNYVDFGEQKGVSGRPTLRSRSLWWRVPLFPAPQIIVPAGVHTEYVFWLNRNRFLIDKRLYGVYPLGSPEKLLASLNTPIARLSFEIWVRTGLGGGLADFTVYEYATVLIPHPGYLDHFPKDIMEEAESELTLLIGKRVGRAKV